MGYIFLFIAALFNLTKSYCSKKISNGAETFLDVVDMALVRNALCMVIGALLIVLGKGGDFRLPATGWYICIAAGVAIGANYVAWVLSLRSGVYLFASTANSASFIVAVVCGIFFFDEKLTVLKGIAIVLMLAAVMFMSRYQTESRGRVSFTYILLLLSVFFSAGISSVTQKWFTRTLPQLSAHIYTFYSLLISTVMLLLVTLFLPERKNINKRVNKIRKQLPSISIAAVCFYGVTYFQTGASALLDAVVMYPVFNGTLLAAASLMAWLCFSEKPSRNSIFGVALVFAAVVLAGI